VDQGKLAVVVDIIISVSSLGCRPDAPVRALNQNATNT